MKLWTCIFKRNIS